MGGVQRQRTIESDETSYQIDDSEPDTYKLGKIQFFLKYDFQAMTLSLKIMRAVNLPAKDFSGTSDPYVKIMLLPDKKTKLTTNNKRKNLNPRWNELFAFEGECLFFIYDISLVFCSPLKLQHWVTIDSILMCGAEKCLSKLLHRIKRK